MEGIHNWLQSQEIFCSWTNFQIFSKQIEFPAFHTGWWQAFICFGYWWTLTSLSKVFYLLSKGIEVAYGFELYTPFAVVVVYIWEQKWVNLVLDV